MTRSITFTEFGGIDRLQITETARPQPGPGQVHVRVRYAALNPIDLTVLAHGQGFGVTPPSGLGGDFSGIVAEIGEEVTDFVPGDLVFGGAFTRSQTEDLVVDAGSLRRVPAGLGLDIAGGLNTAGNTAVAGIRAIAPQPGETVYVSGATGGVGLLAAQLARLLGADVVGTASERKHPLLRSLGIRPVAYGDGVEERIRAAAPNGVQAAYSTQGDADLELISRLGVPGDRVDAIASFGETPKRLGVHQDGSASAKSGDLDWLARAIAYGHIVYPVARVFSLDEAADAYAFQRDGHPTGKVLIRTTDDPLTDAERAQLLG